MYVSSSEQGNESVGLGFVHGTVLAVPAFGSDAFLGHHYLKRGGGGYMREIGTMWQIGLSYGKPCTFGGQKWVIFGIVALRE